MGTDDAARTSGRLDGTGHVLARLAAGEVTPSVFAALDAAARDFLEEHVVHRLVPHAWELRDVDAARHPRAALVVAAALVAVAPDVAQDLHERAVAALAGEESPEWSGYAAYLRGTAAILAGVPTDAAAHLDSALEALPGSSRVRLYALVRTGTARLYLGRLRDAVEAAEQALHEARLVHDVRAQAFASLVLAYLHYWTGDTGALERCARTAIDASELVEDADRLELPVAWVLSGGAKARRGAFIEADEDFGTAVRLASATQVPWVESIALAYRAETFAAWDPAGALRDAEAAVALSTSPIGREASDARLALAIAECEAGNATAAQLTAEDVLRSVRTCIERGRARVVLGRAAIVRKERERAAEHLRAALRELDGTGADYWAATAEILLAEADSGRTAYWLRAARERAARHPTDAGWQRLLRGRGTIRVCVLGEPTVEVNGTRVRFVTRAEESTLYMLALAGPSGLPVDVVGGRVWPDAEPSRRSHRVDNLLSGLRHRLLPTTRLVRDAGRVVLDLCPGECDLAAAVSKVRGLLASPMFGSTERADAERLLAALAEPLLGGAPDEWVVEAAYEVDALRSRLERLLADGKDR